MSVHMGPAWSVRPAEAEMMPYLSFHKNYDPLGMAPAHNRMTGHLLPGITASTRRARYYVFYAWAMHQVRKMRKRNLCSFKSTMYALERVFALSCMAHKEQMHDSGDDTLDHTHITGSREAARVLAECGGDLVPLDFAYAGDTLGGYGMNYQDSMFAMGLAVHEPEDEYERPTEIGVALSDAFEPLASGLEIASYCERESIHRDVLYEMGKKICLCQIKHNKREADLLTRVLFGLHVDDYDDDKEEMHSRILPGARPKSLALMLYAINQSGLQDCQMDGRGFADAAYLGYMTGNSDRVNVWSLPQLQDVSERWGAVVAGANQYVSFSAQVMLWILVEFLQRHGYDNDTTMRAPVTLDEFIEHVIGGLDDGIHKIICDLSSDNGSMKRNTPHTMRSLAMFAIPNDIIMEQNHNDISNISKTLSGSGCHAYDYCMSALEPRIFDALGGLLTSNSDEHTIDMHLAAAHCIILVAVSALRFLWRFDADGDPCIKWWMQMDPEKTGTPLHAVRDAADAIRRDTDAKEFARMFIQRYVVGRAHDAYHDKIRTGMIPATRPFYGGVNSDGMQLTAIRNDNHMLCPAYYDNLRFESAVSIFKDLGLVSTSGGLRCTERGQRVLGRVLRDL